MNLISYIQCEIPLLEFTEKRLSVDIHFKMARPNFYALVFHSVGNLEHGFCDRETWIEKGHDPTLMEFTDLSLHASETHGIIFRQSGKLSTLDVVSLPLDSYKWHVTQV